MPYARKPVDRNKRTFTVGDAATLCGVSPRTVGKWIDLGKLRGVRLPPANGVKHAGHRRVARGDLIDFMRRSGIPLDGLAARPAVAVVSGTDAERDALAGVVAADVSTYRSWFAAGEAFAARPAVLVLDVSWGRLEALATAVRATAAGVRVLLLHAEDDSLEVPDADRLQRPFPPSALVWAVLRLLERGDDQ